jgi:hypothetical protein
MFGLQQRNITGTDTSDDSSASSPGLLLLVSTFFLGPSAPLSVAGRFSVRAYECTLVSLLSDIVDREWVADAVDAD